MGASEESYHPKSKHVFIVFFYFQEKPATLVSALRIVEREFLIDQEVARRKIYSGFAPPGRPKSWRENLLEILKHNTEERIKLDPNTDKSQKGWVGKHLTKIRSSSVEDLINIKHLIQG